MHQIDPSFKGGSKQCFFQSSFPNPNPFLHILVEGINCYDQIFQTLSPIEVTKLELPAFVHLFLVSFKLVDFGANGPIYQGYQWHVLNNVEIFLLFLITMFVTHLLIIDIQFFDIFLYQKNKKKQAKDNSSSVSQKQRGLIIHAKFKIIKILHNYTNLDVKLLKSDKKLFAFYKRNIILFDCPQQDIITMEQDRKYAIFISKSASVRGSNSYWEIVGNLIKNRESINRYFLWNNTAWEVDYHRVKHEQQWLKGYGETHTQAVARKIVQEKLHHIILVTDAEVDKEVVKKTDSVLENAALHNFRIKSSIIYLISTSTKPLDVSSVCPFTRQGQSSVYGRHKGSELKLLATHYIKDDQYISSLDHINLRNFEFEIEKLERIILKLNIGKSGFHAARDQLHTLRKRLVHELSVKETGEDYSNLMRACLEAKDTAGALEYGQRMTYEYMSYEYSMDIQRKINYLVSLCGDLTSQFDYNAIKSNKIKNAADVKEAEIDKNLTKDIANLTVNIIECPIIMDEDVPQILIDQAEPVLMGFDQKIVDDIAVCPLRILNYAEVRAKFKSRLSNYTGTKLNGKLFKNPFTQNKLLGAIPLGRHENHVEVGDSTIAQMVSGGKYLGNLNLYYAVIWYLINEGQIEYLKDIKENAAEHLVYRLRNSFTNASMCGLAQFVTTKVSTDVAIWYIVNSGYFNLPTNRDIFRYHMFNMEPMVKILKVLKYPLHKGVKEHFFRTRAMLKMLYKLKKYNPNFQKGFPTIFKGFYQKGFFVDIENVAIDFWEREVCTMFIPIDGEADIDQIKRIRDILPKCCKYLSNEEVYYLSTLLDASKSASDIALDYNAVIPPLPKAQINWCYGLSDFDVNVKISPGSMRPYLNVDGKGWKNVAMEVWKVEDISELFSGNRYFQRFLLKYKRYPISADELAIFFYNRVIHSGKEASLPFLTEKWTRQFIEKYAAAAAKAKHSIEWISHLFKIMNNKFRQDFEYSYPEQ